MDDETFKQNALRALYGYRRLYKPELTYRNHQAWDDTVQTAILGWLEATRAGKPGSFAWNAGRTKVSHWRFNQKTHAPDSTAAARLILKSEHENYGDPLMYAEQFLVTPKEINELGDLVRSWNQERMHKQHGGWPLQGPRALKMRMNGATHTEIARELPCAPNDVNRIINREIKAFKKWAKKQPISENPGMTLEDLGDKNG